MTTTLDHLASEESLRDFHTSDRSDWRFDLATGTLVPTQRVQVDSHVIDVSLDLVHDTTVQTQRAGNYTLDQRNHEFEGESESRTREAISSGQNSTRTVTRTTPHEGPGAGVTILVVSGTDDVSHHDFAWLQSHSGFSTSEIHGSDGYYRYQSDTDDTLRTTFDSVHSVQRIDGSGDTRYHGNRGLAGDGWNSNWYEETPSGGGIEVSQGSYHLALTHDDDRPNAYDLTVASGSTASVELPGPYRLPTNPQANTPPSGSLGPGGSSAPEDPSEVADLRNQVAAAGSSAAAANAARDQYFIDLAEDAKNLGGGGDAQVGGQNANAADLAYNYSVNNTLGTGGELAIDSYLNETDTGAATNAALRELGDPQEDDGETGSDGESEYSGPTIGPDPNPTPWWQVPFVRDPRSPSELASPGAYHWIIGNFYWRLGVRDLVESARAIKNDPLDAAYNATIGMPSNVANLILHWDQIPDLEKQDLPVKVVTGALAGNGLLPLAKGAWPIAPRVTSLVPKSTTLGTLVDKLSPLTRRSATAVPDGAVAPNRVASTTAASVEYSNLRTAVRFLRENQLFDGAQLRSLTKAQRREIVSGIDLSQPVRVRTLEAGTELLQDVRVGGHAGPWFRQPDTSGSQVGLWSSGRQTIQYRNTLPTQVLESRARPIMDVWTRPGFSVPTEGGGIQYYTFQRYKIWPK